jgi:hypothetical protein
MSPATTNAREPRILVEDLPAEHLDELDYLWERRARTTRSYEQFGSHLADLDRRLEANAEGLEIAPRVSLPLLEEALGGKETARAAAATWVLLRIGGEPATAAVLGALEAGKPPAREGVRQGLVRGPAAPLLERLKPLAAAVDAAIAVAAAEALAAHGTPAAAASLGVWLADPDETVRMAACRVAAWSGAGAERLEPLARGDADAGVRLAAFEAGMWLKVPWVMALGRERAKAKDASNAGQLALFCAIAEKADAPLVAALGAEVSLGPARFGMLAACGNVASIEACLAGMSAKDAPEAEAAGAAFERLTGFGMGAASRVTLPPPEDAGPDASEFAEDAFVTDPALAKQQWESRKKEFAEGRRWCRGLEADGANAADSLDLGSRYETLLRARFKGAWGGSRRELLLLPR